MFRSVLMCIYLIANLPLYESNLLQKRQIPREEPSVSVSLENLPPEFRILAQTILSDLQKDGDLEIIIEGDFDPSIPVLDRYKNYEKFPPGSHPQYGFPNRPFPPHRPRGHHHHHHRRPHGPFPRKKPGNVKSDIEDSTEDSKISGYIDGIPVIPLKDDDIRK
ncbi:hypothetical protein ABEB36_011139 [Hypothenemus hampei]|uniref:Uncharacterized protein n=1 Tax=Hypothenemus hampei TaxID=57062 RepID=A0ABD1EEC9_HYPHA